MRLTSSRQDLATALGSAGRAASARSTIPVLSHVLLKAEGGVVELAATDMEVSLRVPLAAEVTEAGSVAVPRLAADIVRTMADGPVAIEHRANEGVVTLSGGRSSFSLNCLQAADFPELPEGTGDMVAVPARVIVDVVDRVVRAASRDETRPVLTGVLISLGPEGLTAVATDSYRLAVAQAALEAPPAELRQAIVPARAVAEIGRLVAATESEAVGVALTDNFAAFTVGGATLTARVIDGQFPDHRQLIPSEFDHEVTFDRHELSGVLGRIAVLAQRSSPVRLGFDDGQVTVSAISEQVGEGREEVPVVFAGEPVEIGFNVEFLRGGVDAIDGDEVRLGLISPLRPGLLRGAGDDFRYLLMPIRLNA